MTNKYLEKIAKDHMVKGYISPAWQENAIARDHGKEGIKGVGANIGKHVGGEFRKAGRGYLEGIAGGIGGAVVGTGVNALTRGKLPNAGTALGIAGAIGGTVHGAYKSLRNQASEAHEKYKK